MMRSPRARERSESASASITLSGLSAQLRAALAEHDKLVDRVARKQRELEHLEALARSTVAELSTRVAPLSDECRRLDESIHALFREIVDGKLSARARREIRDVYLGIQESGLISPQPEDESDDEEGGADPFPGLFDHLGAQAHAKAAREARVPSAEKHLQRGALRDLYRRLVELLHPDQVQDDDDKARRTEAMKAVTVAFREHDLARLVEIERAWATTAPLQGSDDELARRIEVLAERTRELKKQLRKVEHALRAFRRSPEGELTRGAGPSGGGDAVELAVAAAEAELALLREVRDFVSRFRDGKVTLRDFVEGPVALRPRGRRDAGSSDLMPDDLAAVFAMMDREFGDILDAELGRGRSRRGRKRGR